MADSSYGLKTGLQGEREFSRTITYINHEMRVLGSETKLVASQFDRNDKSIGELKEEMAKGAISADMVADAFASATEEGGRFHGAMEAQSKTFTGQLSTMRDGID